MSLIKCFSLSKIAALTAIFLLIQTAVPVSFAAESPLSAPDGSEYPAVAYSAQPKNSYSPTPGSSPSTNFYNYSPLQPVESPAPTPSASGYNTGIPEPNSPNPAPSSSSAPTPGGITPGTPNQYCIAIIRFIPGPNGELIAVDGCGNVIPGGDPAGGGEKTVPSPAPEEQPGGETENENETPGSTPSNPPDGGGITPGGNEVCPAIIRMEMGPDGPIYYDGCGNLLPGGDPANSGNVNAVKAPEENLNEEEFQGNDPYLDPFIDGQLPNEEEFQGNDPYLDPFIDGQLPNEEEFQGNDPYLDPIIENELPNEEEFQGNDPWIDPNPDPNDPITTMGGDCSKNPWAAGCNEEWKQKFCSFYPEDPRCSTSNNKHCSEDPWAEGCNEEWKKKFCSFYPEDPRCGGSNPGNPEPPLPPVKPIPNPPDPKPSDPGFPPPTVEPNCSINPWGPGCGGEWEKKFCIEHPQDPRCGGIVVDPPYNPNPDPKDPVVDPPYNPDPKDPVVDPPYNDPKDPVIDPPYYPYDEAHTTGNPGEGDMTACPPGSTHPSCVNEDPEGTKWIGGCTESPLGKVCVDDPRYNNPPLPPVTPIPSLPPGNPPTPGIPYGPDTPMPENPPVIPTLPPADGGPGMPYFPPGTPGGPRNPVPYLPPVVTPQQPDVRANYESYKAAAPSYYAAAIERPVYIAPAPVTTYRPVYVPPVSTARNYIYTPSSSYVPRESALMSSSSPYYMPQAWRMPKSGDKDDDEEEN